MNSSTNQIHKQFSKKTNISCLPKKDMIKNSNKNTWKLWIISCQFPLRHENIFERLRLNTGNVCISKEMGAEKMIKKKFFQLCNINWITGIWNSSFSKELWLKFLTLAGKTWRCWIKADKGSDSQLNELAWPQSNQWSFSDSNLIRIGLKLPQQGRDLQPQRERWSTFQKKSSVCAVCASFLVSFPY